MGKETTLYTQVYEALKTKIYCADYPCGSKLPSIATLVDEYNVSIITIRKALSVLRDHGFIEMKQGKEAKVIFDNRVSPEREEYINWLTEHQDSILDIYWMHQLVVPQIVSFGAQYVDEKTLMQLKAMVNPQKIAKMGFKKVLETLHTFLIMIIAQGKNNLAVDLYSKIHTFIKTPLLLVCDNQKISENFPENTIKNMEKVIELIEKKNFNLLYNLVKEEYQHLTLIFEDYLFKAFNREHKEKQISFMWGLNSQANFLYSIIANDILVAICCGDYVRGEYLPSEAALCKKFQASPATIRNALKLLNKYKIIETQNGKGSLIIYNIKNEISKKPSYSDDEIKTYLECLQLLALIIPVWLKFSLKNIDVEKVEKFERKLAGNGDDTLGVLCNVAVLIDFICYYSPCKAVRDTYPQIISTICLNSRYRPYYQKVYPEFYKLMTLQMQEAINLMKKSDAFGVANILLKQITTQKELVQKIYKFKNDSFTLPFPDEKTLFDI
ncbi:MAG: GntR family transcriptional regulator [Clostridiales bacterium]